MKEPWNRENGRKKLPKSFIDRFILIKMENYQVHNLREFIERRFGKNFIFYQKLSLRGNIRSNLIYGDQCINEKHTININDQAINITDHSINITDHS